VLQKQANGEKVRLGRRTALRAGLALGAVGAGVLARSPVHAAPDRLSPAAQAAWQTLHLEVEHTPMNPVSITRAGNGPAHPQAPQSRRPPSHSAIARQQSTCQRGASLLTAMSQLSSIRRTLVSAAIRKIAYPAGGTDRETFVTMGAKHAESSTHFRSVFE
jgi:hypothetical protein